MLSFLASQEMTGDSGTTWLVGTLVTGLLGGLGWLLRVWLVNITREIRELRNAVDTSTIVQTIALLDMAALIPGAKPVLEKSKAACEVRLKQPIEPGT